MHCNNLQFVNFNDLLTNPLYVNYLCRHYAKQEGEYPKRVIRTDGINVTLVEYLGEPNITISTEILFYEIKRSRVLHVVCGPLGSPGVRCGPMRCLVSPRTD